ncbi:MAG: GAF domain-containing protein [Ktedonobacteraceae bacterium]|nr:GAF domain-containing protein [Ktedonobacteraceae bacterium]
MEHEPFERVHWLMDPLVRGQSLSALSEEQPAISDESASERHIQANVQEPSEGGSTHMLREVAQITAQSFQSSQEAMNVALDVLGRFLDSQTLFIGRVGVYEAEKKDAADEKSVEQHTLKIVAVRNRGTSLPAIGSEGPLSRTYCQTVWRTQQPLIVEDARRYPFYQGLATTEEYNIGSYIGVPLIYSDGRVYGTLCSQDARPRPLADQPEKLELMQIVARFLISHIEREELTTHLREAEQVQAELARKERQARAEADRRVHELEAIFETIGDGLLVCDRNGRLQTNTAARGLLAIDSPQDDHLQYLFERHGESALVRDEHGQPLAVEHWPITRVLQGEHLIGTQIVNIQRVNTLGEIRYLSVSGMPIADQRGQINGGVLVFRDVTERYLQTRQTQETLDSLLTLAEALAWLPENGLEFFSAPASQSSPLQSASKCLKHLISTILQCQDVGMISMEHETVKWQLLTECDPEQEHESPWWQEVRNLFDSTQDADVGHLRNNEVVMHALQPQVGTDTPMLVETPMFLGNRLLGALMLMYRQRDATLTPGEDALVKAVAKLTGLVYERERLLQEQAETRARALALQETNQRFNEFLSIASHELKGPLTVLRGSMQLARRALRKLSSQRALEESDLSSSLLEKMQRYIERAEQQVRMQDRLASDLIDVSRIRAGKLQLHLQPCDMGQIVCEIVEDQRQMTEGRVINLELSTEKIAMYGDADRLGQVVNNYLTNALKYSSSDRPVGVAVTTDGESVCVTVSDEGVGLTPDEQQRVWERFYRVKGVHVLSGNGIGLGLGLHICKTIIEQHGGRVGLQSTPGEGSHFWFTLPLNRAGSSQGEEQT